MSGLEAKESEAGLVLRWETTTEYEESLGRTRPRGKITVPRYN